MSIIPVRAAMPCPVAASAPAAPGVSPGGIDELNPVGTARESASPAPTAPMRSLVKRKRSGAAGAYTTVAAADAAGARDGNPPAVAQEVMRVVRRRAQQRWHSLLHQRIAVDQGMRSLLDKHWRAFVKHADRGYKDAFVALLLPTNGLLCCRGLALPAVTPCMPTCAHLRASRCWLACIWITGAPWHDRASMHASSVPLIHSEGGRCSCAAAAPARKH